MEVAFKDYSAVDCQTEWEVGMFSQWCHWRGWGSPGEGVVRVGWGVGGGG